LRQNTVFGALFVKRYYTKHFLLVMMNNLM